MKTITVASLLLTVCVGCGGREVFPYRYQAGCLTEIESGLELYMHPFTRNVEYIQRLMIRVGAVRSQADFCEQFGSVRVRIYETNYTPAGDLGSYDLFGGILLGNYTSALLHEFLHAANATHLQVGTAWHEGWDKNGYYDADNEFGLRMERVVPERRPDGKIIDQDE